MKVQTFSYSYALFRSQVALGLKWFHRDFVVEGSQNIPANTPIVLISNHQNALMDAVLICGVIEKQCHWLTRADMFKSPVGNKLLRGLNMLPVYRDRDKPDDLSGKNAEIFRICRQRLHRNCIISLFPEGTHRGLYKLWPFKKGVSRLLAGAVAEGIDQIIILPVGLDYTSFYEFGGSVMIRIGEPVALENLCDSAALASPKGQYELTEKLRQLLLPLVTHIHSDEYREAFTTFRGLIEYTVGRKTLIERQERFTHIANDITAKEEHSEFLINVVAPLFEHHQRLHLQHDFVPERSNAFHRILLFLLLPLAMPAIVLFSPIYIGAEVLVARFIQDRLFRNSIRATIWVFLTPVYALLWIGIMGMSFGMIAAASTFSVLLISAAVARFWIHGARDLGQWITMKKIAASGRTVAKSYIQLRGEFMKYIQAHYGKL